eukprot:comp5033_c0_seq1/m.1132 comp5033_c0_seq1/g.1132  ORF comp5033_c0_seq1/g.1132 comp5033_c0_seq1/m.1132 type:complete len:288 (-) comp5033_c0_seq1:24-887(-)
MAYRGASRPVDRSVQLSKKLSYTLRHAAAKQNIPMRADGFCLVSTILSHREYRGFTLDELKAVVENNDKKRYLLREEEGQLWIRANQGHSLKDVEVEMDVVKSSAEIPQAIHGTYLDVWGSIKSKGLSKMNRQHIHLAPDLPGKDGVISGMRKSSELYVYVDVEKAMADGMVFYRSANNVILTEGYDGFIPAAFFAKVLTASTPQRDLIKEEAPAGKTKQEVKAEPKPETDPLEREIRKAEKRVKGIEDLKVRQKEGKPLEKNQLEKLEKEDEARKELAALLAKRQK